MSQTKTFAVDRGTTTRVKSTGTQQGAGDGKRLYVGRYSGDQHRSYLRFAHDWTNVGSIVSAVLSLYTDDNGGQLGDVMAASDTPKVRVTLLTSAFSEHTGSATYDVDDWTNPSLSTSTTYHTAYKAMAKDALGVTNIDVTAIFRKMAPTTVAGGGGHANYGIALTGTTDPVNNWAGISEDAEVGVVAYVPVITLTYEYGLTAPTTPSVLAPSGNVATFTDFSGDFEDVKDGDVLAFSEVEVYGPAHSATIDTGDLITSSAHGQVVGDIVYFTSLTGGVGLSTYTPYYVIASGLTANAFKVSATLGGSAVNVTDAYEAASWARRVYAPIKQAASAADVTAATFHYVPSGWTPLANTAYQWRGRVYDQSGQVSAWSALTTFTLTNTAPDAPTLTDPPTTVDSLGNLHFRGTFADDDVGDYLGSYQVQFADSTYADGAAEWDDPAYLPWDSGRVFALFGATEFDIMYGGYGLAAGDFKWRARVWDQNGEPSAWSYRAITTTEDFEQDANNATPEALLRPNAPWRVIIKEMQFNNVSGTVTAVAATNLFTQSGAHGLLENDPVRFSFNSAANGGAPLSSLKTYYVIASGLTTTQFKVSETVGGDALDLTTDLTGTNYTRTITTRGPGSVIGILEDALNVGATLLYNSPGEIHFTLPKSHPQVPIIEPRQVHYTVEFRQADGWREVFAGLIVDYDTNGNDVIFYGIDYLGLLQFVVDERYDPTNIDKPYTSGGSKYVNTPIYTIITNLLAYSRYTNSIVGFITTGTISPSVSETPTFFSTYLPILDAITGLLDSHRAGTGKRTRLWCEKTGASTYRWRVDDSPGVARDNLRLRYGELVNGYRVIPFGKDWSTRVAGIGRDKDGVKVRYVTQTAPGISERLWGRWVRPAFFDGLADANDLARRVKQTVVAGAKFGKQIGLGIRTGFLQPRDGYDIADQFLVDIEDGPVSTSAFGSGYWDAVGITWTATGLGQSDTTLTLYPREDTTSPSGELLTNIALSTQAEWQIGWTPPNPLAASSTYWLDQTTGISYVKTDAGFTALTGITGTV